MNIRIGADMLKKIKGLFARDFLFVCIVIIFVITHLNFFLGFYLSGKAWDRCMAKFSVSDCEDIMD